MLKEVIGRASLSRLAALVGIGLSLAMGISDAAAADPCGPGSNPIVCENSKPGTPSSEWDILKNGDLSIQGFATDMSVNVGESIGFKVDTDAIEYSLLIYRMGWYGGDGARLVDTVTPSATLPQVQPECLVDESTGLIDCGNWGLSATWDVPEDAVSGVYIARLRRPDTGGDSHILFVVRDDARASDVLFQTSDTTWQAYNDYGDQSLYKGWPAGRAYKVSYNRPMFARGGTPNGRDSFFGSEYAMLRWLERNGYDVSYFSGVDTDRAAPSALLDHQVFLSVGHDEYWSGAQRAAVENARDAGVNLIFASGNEVYWKTRWEPSIDGSGTSHRTLVAYKETIDSAKIDPSAEWTGTWRDPRFSPPSNGGRPENELTGTLFTVNCCTYALKVPAEYGDLRFWRNTGVASLAPGSEAVFPFGTLGYEWDEDPDNGFRPPGAFRMSSTTETVPQRLIDYGSTVAVEEATHHLMMYRAASGALVFGAGTVQWSWGLDDYHDGTEAPVDPDMQQATVNVLADMGVQPETLENGLVAATASTDTVAPTVSIASPSTGASFEHGDLVTVTGSAIDSGGVVAAVEVSLDGGTRWHPASGRESWSYTGSPRIRGPQTFMARAVDDSGNLGPSEAVTVDIDCPCTIFGDAPLPRVDAFVASSPLELGVRFQSDIDGYITGVRFYKGPTDTGTTHSGSLWSTDGTRLATGTFTGESASGWQEMTFTQPVAITAGTSYIASYFATVGYTALVDGFASEPYLSPPLQALRSSPSGPNGIFESSSVSTFPSRNAGPTNYWVDVVFTDVAPPDTNPPTVIAMTPVDGTSSVSVSAAVSFVLDEAIDLGTSLVELLDGNGAAVPGTLSFDEASSTATFTPSAPLAHDQAHTVSASFTDPTGNTMLEPVSFSFRTSQADGAVAALWDDSAVPATVDSGDASSIEVGTKFVADRDLNITGVRFYKSAANTGTHVGSLWDDSGTRLAQVTFENESSAGWQEASFETAVEIASGQTYVISYFAPNGRYSATGGYFATARTSGPLTAPASNAVGGNGVYAYGDGGFPTASANRTNYWVTPTYEMAADTRPPELIATAPIDDASSVALETVVSATFDEPVDGGSIGIVVTDGEGAEVDGSLVYDEPSRTATFVPSGPLVADSVYTVEVSAADLLGNATDGPLEFWFRTSQADGAVAALWDDSAVPAIVDSGDAGSIEVGTKFVADRDLNITGVRFYKSAANTGTHVGSLWDGSGTLLAQVTFGGESSTGWQQAMFAEPVRIASGQTYVVSYHAPNGRYSATGGYFATARTSGPLTAPASNAVGGNGVYVYGDGGYPDSDAEGTNYWVTPTYEEIEDQMPPTLVETTPAAGSSSVALDAEVSATFDEPVDAASIAILVTGESGDEVTGSVAYEPSTRTVSFTPSSPLALDTAHTVQISASDIVGNATSVPLSFSFRTVLPDGAVAALWDDSAVPVGIDSGDAGSIEVGTKFVADRDLDITGVRFYKSVANTGTHVGSLWDDSGTLLARVTFGSESSSGWQQATFSEPVGIKAGQRYVVSYFAPEGHYSATGGYFRREYSSGPLTALASRSSGGNGVYDYGDGGYPTSSFNRTNYWVSPVYELPPPPDDVDEGLWDYSATPATIDSGDAGSIEIGTRFFADEDLDIIGLRFYKSLANTGPHVGSLWDASGALLAQATFEEGSSTGWQEVRFLDPVRITAGETYVASYLAPNGHYSANPGYFDQAHSSGPLTAPASISGARNGVYAYGNGGFPTGSYNKTNYWIGPVYKLP